MKALFASSTSTVSIIDVITNVPARNLSSSLIINPFNTKFSNISSMLHFVNFVILKSSLY